MKETIDALRALLDRLDALAQTLDDDAFDDLNAEFEDTLLLLEDDADSPDTRADAREELLGLAHDFGRWAEAEEIVDEIRKTVRESGELES